MKAFALVAVSLVPRPALFLVADMLCRFSWRKLLKAALQVIVIAAAGAVFGLFLALCVFGGSD